MGRRAKQALPTADAERPAEASSEPEPSDSLSPEELRRRARLGVVLLLARTVIHQFIVLGGTVLLARLLEPKDFGVYAIVQFALSFFAFFGDAGLGAALIQKPGVPSQRDLSSVFNLQVLLSLGIVAIVWALAGNVTSIWKDLPDGAVWLLRALSIGLLLTVLRVIPSILMERQLLFGRLAALEIITSVSFYGVAVALAATGVGVWALVGGSLAQGVLALGFTLLFRPWMPSAVLDRAALGPILRFGLPFQLKNVIGFANGAIAPVYAGAVLGSTPVGYVNWAQTTAYFPLKLVEIMGRVTFPLYSRLQNDRATFAETLGRSIQICALGTFFFVGLFLGLAPQIIHVVFTDKWMPALPLFYVYTVAISIGFLSPLAGSALDASGRPQIFARLALGWTLLNWIIVPLVTPRWGMLGFAAGYSVHVVVGNIAVLVVMVYLIPGVRTFRRLWAALLAGGAVWACARLVAPWVSGWLSLGGAVVLCVALFALVVLTLDRKGLLDAMALVPTKRRPRGAPLANEAGAGR